MLKIRVGIHFIISLAIFGNFCVTYAENKMTPYQLLNDLRNFAGLKAFQKNANLEQSAQNHADYMVDNHIISHYQSNDYNLFTGISAADRAGKVGYESRNVTENISVGQKNYSESIEALFETLYHRLLFLSFINDEIGIAHQKNNADFYAYNMGNQQLNKLCNFSGFNKSASYFTNVCNHLVKVPSRQVNRIKLNAQKISPPMVLWPPDQSKIATIGFWEEHPNPLGGKISGYPITVQLNPFYYRNVTFMDVRLFEYKSMQNVSGLLISKKNDKHQKLSNHEFGFFPDTLLKWGMHYQVVVKFIANKLSQTVKWTFQTRKLSSPKIRIHADQELLLLKPHQKYLIEIEATKPEDMIKELNWSHNSNLKLVVKKIYNNLLEVQLVGDFCQKVNFKLNGNRRFTVQISRKMKMFSKYFNKRNKFIMCK